MAKVKKVGDEPIEKMLRRFRRECNIDGIKDDYKRSLLYEKPSVVKKRKQQDGVIETRRRMRMKNIVL
jgi:ribosomal protein S21